MERLIIVTADTMYHTLQQYLGDQIPEKARVTKVLYNPGERGAIRLEYTSKEKPANPAALATFNIKKQY